METDLKQLDSLVLPQMPENNRSISKLLSKTRLSLKTNIVWSFFVIFIYQKMSKPSMI